MTTPEHRELRQRTAHDLRKCPNDNDRFALAVDYAVEYGCLRLPTLQEIDILLRAEGTHDVVTAEEVLDTIVSSHPAYTVVLRLHDAYGANLPDDEVIGLAIKDEIARACVPTPNTLTRVNSINKALFVQLDKVNEHIRNERISMLEVLLPDRVRDIWRLCQAMGFSPFMPNTTQVS